MDDIVARFLQHLRNIHYQLNLLQDQSCRHSWDTLKRNQLLEYIESLGVLMVQDERPAPGWVEVGSHAAKREIRLPSPPLIPEPSRPSEPAVFRQPVRKRARTRWHADELRDREEEEDRRQPGDEVEEGEAAVPSAKAGPPVAADAKEKASPQVCLH